MKIGLFLISLLAISSPKAMAQAFSSPQRTTTESGTEELHYVEGRVEITAEDAERMTFNERFFDDNFKLRIMGEDMEHEDGVVEESALDGQGVNRGFQVVYPVAGTHQITISLEGVKHFENFYATTENVAGGALMLYNGGDINFNGLDTIVTFSNNLVEATSGHASGGAIFVTGGGTISDLRADFINNEARVADIASEVNYARGGALFVGYYDAHIVGSTVAKDDCIVGNLYGDFTGNKAAFGGGIYLGEFGEIGSIHGVFENNIAEGDVQPGGSTGGAQGGAIRTWKGTIGTVYGNFVNNVAHSTNGDAGGGAISLNGTIVDGGFHGDFTGNVARSEKGEAHGGAFTLKNQSGDAEVVFTDVSFKNNGASTSLWEAGAALGGAFFIENSSDVVFRAVDKDVEFTDNFLHYGGAWDPESQSVVENENHYYAYNSIYASDSLITLETQKDATITINDGMGLVGESNLIVDAHGSERYDVLINDGVSSSLVTIENGGVKLGSYKHEGGEGETTYGAFTSNDISAGQTHLVIKDNGLLNARAEALTDVGSITLTGELELTADLNQSGGTLRGKVNSAGNNTGKITILANTTIGAGNSVHVHELAVDHHLAIEQNAAVSINHLTFRASDMAEINGDAAAGVIGHQISMNQSATLEFDVVDLYVDSLHAGDYYDLIVSDGQGNITLDWSEGAFEVNVFTYGGLAELEADDYNVVELEDGGLRVTILQNWVPVPEPSSATLSLLALMGLMARRRRII